MEHTTEKLEQQGINTVRILAAECSVVKTGRKRFENRMTLIINAV